MQSDVLIRDLYAAKRAAKQPVISFEFFPPKTDEGERNFFDKTLPQLAALKPDYCSVTYGAGGSTRDKTLAIVETIQQRHHLPAMAHLTCVGSTEPHLREIIAHARERGIRNILALRGDPPVGASQFQKTAGGFAYATRQCDELLRAGVPGIHFYTLNKVRSTTRILHNLGLV